MTSSSLVSPLSTTPAETRSIFPHPTSALATHHQSHNSKHLSGSVSLKLRREMTQPTLSRIEVVSSTDSPIEKLAANDNYLFQFRSNTNNSNPVYKLSQTQQPDSRQKSLKANTNRLSVDFLPVRQLSRSKATNPLPSPKGKHI